MQQKELGFWMCTALVVGNIIGIGIYMMPAALAPFGMNALLAWGVTALGCAVLAKVFARLAREYPNADGPYGYIRSNLGDPAAYFAMWCYWVSLWITNATLAVAVAGYVGAAVPPLASVPPVLVALVLLWVFVGVNLYGARTGGRVQVVVTTLKLLPMLAVILLGLWVLFSEPQAYVRSVPKTPLNLGDVMAASTIALFAMLGLESATVPAGRVQDPGRTIPRSTLVGTIATALIYIAVSIVPLLLIPQAQLMHSNAPFVDLLDRYLGVGNGQVLAMFVVLSGLGGMNGWTLLVGELTRTMANNGVFPAVLRSQNARGAPSIALILTAVLASAMILMNYSKSLVQGFVFLSTIVTAANLPLYLFCALALIRMRLRGERPSSGDLFVLGVLGSAYCLFVFIGLGREPFVWGAALAAAGLPVYLYMRRNTAGTAAPTT